MSETFPHSRSWMPLLTVGAAAGAGLLGVLGGWLQQDGAGAVELVYRALQLFVLDAAGLGSAPPGPVLQVARFVAPAVTVLALVVGFRRAVADRWSRARAASASGHVVVCGSGGPAIQLARRLRGDGRSVVMVQDRVSTPIGDGVRIVEGDPKDAETLRGAGIERATACYVLLGASGSGAAVAMAAATLNPDLAVVAEVASDDVADSLRVPRVVGSGVPAARIDFVSLDDVAARRLVTAHGPRTGKVTIRGTTPFARAVVRALVRDATGTQRRTLVVDGDDDQLTELSTTTDAHHRGWSIERRSVPPGGVVFVCRGDEDATLTEALRLHRAGVTAIACLDRAEPFRTALGPGYGPTIFGRLDAYDAAGLDDASAIARLARGIHDRYVEHARMRGEDAEVNASLVAWDALPRHLRQSNVAQAEHLRDKIVALGATLTTVRPAEEFRLGEREVEKLARMEHQRWMNERLAAGFVHGHRREGTRHPDLVDWELLSEVGREKDRDTVRQLPELLASEGLHLVATPDRADVAPTAVGDAKRRRSPSAARAARPLYGGRSRRHRRPGGDHAVSAVDELPGARSSA